MHSTYSSVGVILMNIVFVELLSIARVNVGIVTVLSKEIATCAASGSLTLKMKEILRHAEQARQ